MVVVNSAGKSLEISQVYKYTSANIIVMNILLLKISTEVIESDLKYDD